MAGIHDLPYLGLVEGVVGHGQPRQHHHGDVLLAFQRGAEP
ncbi:hypothetical protein [Streptomyces sp. 184]